LKDPDAVIAYHKDELGSMGIKGTYGKIEANVEVVKRLCINRNATFLWHFYGAKNYKRILNNGIIGMVASLM